MGGPDLRVTAALFVKFNRVSLPSWNQDPVRIPSHHDDLYRLEVNVKYPMQVYGDLQITFLDVLQLTRYHKNIIDNECNAVSSLRQATREL